MNVNNLTLKVSDLFDDLRFVSPLPKTLYWSGPSIENIISKPKVAIVGSRKATTYGKTITYDLVSKLSRSGVVIVSGLAFGIDSYAHRAALEAGGITVAILPSPLDNIYPAAHYNLAKQILKNGGALISEYPAGTQVRQYNFIARNRLISSLATVVVIPEAARNSGSLHTARFALEQGKTVMAVPGDINRPMSEGCNNLIKSGAIPVTDAEDIFFALKLKPQTREKPRMIKGSAEQRKIFELISSGISDQDQLAAISQLSAAKTSTALTHLELQGHIRPLGAGHWTIV